MRWGNAGVTSLNHIMDTVTKNFLTFEKIKTLIKSNNLLKIDQICIPTTLFKNSKIYRPVCNVNPKYFFPFQKFLNGKMS
jgi:hypothetical protein